MMLYSFSTSVGLTPPDSIVCSISYLISSLPTSVSTAASTSFGHQTTREVFISRIFGNDVVTIEQIALIGAVQTDRLTENHARVIRSNPAINACGLRFDVFV